MAQIHGAYVDGADNAENGDILLKAMKGGTMTTVLQYDESADGWLTSQDIEITTATTGIIIRDTNGVRYRITVNTSGALVVTSL
jgi:hypothetical protein